MRKSFEIQRGEFFCGNGTISSTFPIKGSATIWISEDGAYEDSRKVRPGKETFRGGFDSLMLHSRTAEV